MASDERTLQLYRTMARIRAFENAAEEASRGSVAAFGASLAVRYPRAAAFVDGTRGRRRRCLPQSGNHDYVTSTHRGHGHTLAKGASMEAMMKGDQFGRAVLHRSSKIAPFTAVTGVRTPCYFEP